MTAPIHSFDVKGKGRYYHSCGNTTCPFGDDEFISITNAQGVLAKPALVPAAVKITAETAWANLPSMVALSRQPMAGINGCDRKRVADRCGHCRFCLTAHIKAEHRNVWDSAADHGTAVHAAAYSENIGQPRSYDPDVEPFIGSYLQALSVLGVDIDNDVEAAETTVISRRHSYAGTGDIWLHLHINPKTLQYDPKRRWLWLVDIKTSRTKPVGSVYPDQVLQLAGLRYAEAAVLPDDTEVEQPKFDGVALLNLRDNAWGLIPLPADKAAHRAFVNAVGLQTFMHSIDTKPWKPVDAPTITDGSTTRKVA